MPYATTQAFVLGGQPLKEQDQLVHLLTADRGILKAMAPGSKKVRNRFGSLFELFTEGEFVYYWQEDKEFITISKGEILESYFNIVSQPENIFYFYLMAEVLLKFVPYNHKDKRIYKLVHAILRSRAAGTAIEMILLYFLTWILRLEGMMFNPFICHNCYREKPERVWLRTDFRGILCARCRSNESLMLTADELLYIHWTKDLSLWKDKIDRAKMIRIFKRKIEYHGEFALNSSVYLPEFK